MNRDDNEDTLGILPPEGARINFDDYEPGAVWGAQYAPGSDQMQIICAYGDEGLVVQRIKNPSKHGVVLRRPMRLLRAQLEAAYYSLSWSLPVEGVPDE